MVLTIEINYCSQFLIKYGKEGKTVISRVSQLNISKSVY